MPIFRLINILIFSLALFACNNDGSNDLIPQNSLPRSDTDNDGARIRIGVSLENNSNLSYSLEHLILVASYFDQNSNPHLIGILSFDSSGGGNDTGNNQKVNNIETSYDMEAS